jgi:hypothetical protein
MTKRIPLTLEQANALKPGDRFLDLYNGSTQVVVEKDGNVVCGFYGDEWVWSVAEADYVGPTQECESIYKFDEMAASEGVWFETTPLTFASPKLTEVFSVFKESRRLLTLKADGTIEADLDDIDEGAKIFVESLAKYWLQTTGKSVVNP